MKKYLGIAFCGLCFFFAGNRERLYAQQKEELPVYREVLYLGNMYAGSQNPVALYFSPIYQVLDFDLNYGVERGSLHDVDRSSKVNLLGVGISGLHRFNKVICYGNISYLNQKDYDRRWNSNLYLSGDNPFILGDSIASDFSTEKFDLTGTVAYSPNDRFVAALRLHYETGSSANQTDPRPRTDGMHFAVHPGVNYAFNDRFALGLSAEVKLFNESISHLVVDPRESYVYFRFNGMGDYSAVSTGISQSYPRDYDGTEYKGALQFKWDNQRRLSNLLEGVYASNSEDARDGGEAFTFLGGDYSREMLEVSDRFRIKGERYIHNITLAYTDKTVKGIWYEQTQYLDPEKNNQLAYKVQASGLKHKETASLFGLQYRMDKMKAGFPSCTFSLNGNLTDSKTIHIEGDGYNRKYTLVDAGFGVTKYFSFGKNHITAAIEGLFSAPVTSSMRATPRLEEVYTAPSFEYLMATKAGGHLHFAYRRRFDAFWVGLYADASMKWTGGDGNYSKVLENTDHKAITLGANILF